MNINFILMSKTSAKSERHLTLSLYANKVHFRTTIGISVPEKNWDSKKQRVKGDFVNSAGMSSMQINNRLSKIEDILTKWAVGITKYTYIDSDVLKHAARSAISLEIPEATTSAKKPFFDAYMEFMKEQSVVNSWEPSTMAKYRLLEKHLRAYNPKVTLNRIDNEYLEGYTYYMYDELDMQPASVVKEHKLLRAFMNWAVRKGITNDERYKDYRPMVAKGSKPVIFLKPSELKRLTTFKIPENGTRVKLVDYNGNEYSKIVMNRGSLMIVRDLFLFASFTGLRFSDVQNLQWKNIINGELRITAQKTLKDTRFVLNKEAMSILEKYRGTLLGGYCLPTISNAKENIYLKELFELFGLNDAVTVIKTKNGTRVRETFARWQLMSTHAARRTFVCFSLAAGISPLVVAKFTGHSSITSMKPYIEVAEETKRSAMNSFSEMFDKI